MYVRVALNIPTEKIFSYSVPGNLEKEAITGKRVIVPFGKRILTGYIIEKTPTAEVDNVKEIREIPACEPFFTEDDLRFYLWVSQYYLYPFGKTLFEILPTAISPKKEKVSSLQKKGLVRLEAKEDYHIPGKVTALEEADGRIHLNDDQEQAIRHIVRGLATK